MITEHEITAAATQGRFRAFYDRLRMDMIEAQCALESGKLIRASELIEGVMRDAKRCEQKILGRSSSTRRGETR